MSNNVRPELLEGLDFENKYMQQTARSRAKRRVQLKRGDSWLLRFLPAQLGPKKRAYARIATHWLNMKPIVCLRHTEPDFGGDPSFPCPVCELSDELNDDRNEKVADFGYDIRANTQWHTYCAVFEKIPNGTETQLQSMAEVLQPYEFNHYRTTWEEWTAFLKQGVRRTPMSILDFEKGNDFWVTKTGKGLRLDKQDAAPIFPLDDENFKANCDKLIAACKDPSNKLPTDSQLDDFCDKAREEAANIVAGRSAGRGGKPSTGGARGRETGGGDREDLPEREERRPARRPVEENTDNQPARRSARSPEPEAEPYGQEVDQPVEQEEAPVAPPRRTATATSPARPATAPARPARPAPAPEAEPEQEAATTSEELPPEEEQQPEVESEQEAPPPVRPVARPAAAPARPTTPARAATPPARPSAVTPARAAAAAAAAAKPARPSSGAPVAQESLDEDESIAEEKHDAAPPAPVGEEDEGAAETPPPVKQTGQLGSNIRARIAGVGTKKAA